MYKRLVSALAGSALVLTTIAALGSTALAQETLQLSLGGSESTVTDGGFDYLSDDPFLSLGQLHVEASFVPNLWFGLEYQWGVEEDDTFVGIDTSLDIDGLMLTTRYQYDALPFLAPYVGFAGGFYHLKMDAKLINEDREQSLFIPGFQGALGVSIHSPRGWLARTFQFSRRSWAGQLGIVIIFELGYRLVGDASFDNLVRPELDKEPEPEDRLLETSATNLGDVDLSGVMARSALVVRF